MIEFRPIPIAKLAMNTGQIEGLPANPRQWTQEELDKLAKSIEETPELLDARGAIVVPHKGKFVVLGGNMRVTAARKLDLKEMPCAVLPEDTAVKKLREIVVKDNGSFGAWDFDALANEWDDEPLTDWGVPAWDAAKDEQPFTPTIEDHEREGADYDSPKMVFQFTAAEFSFVSDALAQYDANKETALLMLLGYEAGAKE